MTPPLRRLSFFLCAVGIGLCAAYADADLSVLAKARESVGPESAIEAVQTLRFVGELEVVDGDAPAGDGAKIEIIFQKPYKQRITATSESRTETTALDGYDAWQRVADVKNPAQWQVTLLGPDQIKRLRANTFENLAFYRGIDRQGGRIDDLGAATVDGVACHKLAFVYGPGIVFTRSFEVATGRLVLTETESGTQIREEGSILSGGLRFPQRIITTNPLPDGKIRVIRVVFNAIEVNADVDASTFAVPPLSD